MEPLEACSHPLKLLEKVEANKHEMVTTQSLWDKEIVTEDEGNLDFDHATLRPWNCFHCRWGVRYMILLVWDNPKGWTIRRMTCDGNEPLMKVGCSMSVFKQIGLIKEEDLEVFMDVVNDMSAMNSPLSPPPPCLEWVGPITSLKYNAYTHPKFRKCGGTYPNWWSSSKTKQDDECMWHVVLHLQEYSTKWWGGA